ncbi:MAG TPA: hypothetical protein VMY34_10090 [Acidimicrobiales bacterium]|nr:hypothetical protein [Acidimicrobiales bacterium]
MTNPRHRHHEIWEHLDPRCGGGDLRLDASRGKEQVDDVVTRRQHKTRGGQSTATLLLDGGQHLVAGLEERIDHRLSPGVAVDRHDEVDVAGEPRLTPDRHSKATNKRMVHAERVEAGGRRSGNRLEVHHRETGNRTTPGASIGRLVSQLRSLRSISASDAPGSRRRRLWRIRLTPMSAMASAI